MQYRHIAKIKECNHIMLGNNYISRNYVWNNQRIGNIFRGMKRRCYSPHDKNYSNYGAKGIKICSDWLNNPKTFEDWAIQNGYDDALTIDRINETKDYCPTNCRWVTLENNSRYKSTTHLITVNGITKTGREWSDCLHLGINTINTYIRQYGEQKVNLLIQKMLLDSNINKHRKSKQTWFDVYDIH